MQNKINKSDIIKNIAAKEQLPEDAVKSIVDSVFDNIKQALYNSIPVSIKGFGTFFTKTVKARFYQSFDGQASKMVKQRELPKLKFSNVIIKKIKEEEDA